ncbi:MAG: hypothetical protein AMXMBFR33_18670 [Candidatus Xenobia bacterium]|jgi:hypothetical protein
MTGLIGKYASDKDARPDWVHPVHTVRIWIPADPGASSQEVESSLQGPASGNGTIEPGSHPFSTFTDNVKPA